MQRRLGIVKMGTVKLSGLSFFGPPCTLWWQ